MPIKYNFKQCKKALQVIDMTLVRRVEWDEYRVNFRNGAEATAYYTNDLEDAVKTGLHMAEERARANSTKEATDWLKDASGGLL